jgi:hypothetical protein
MKESCCLMNERSMGCFVGPNAAGVIQVPDLHKPGLALPLAFTERLGIGSGGSGLVCIR